MVATGSSGGSPLVLWSLRFQNRDVRGTEQYQKHERRGPISHRGTERSSNRGVSEIGSYLQTKALADGIA